MKKTLIGVLLAIVLLFAVGLFFFSTDSKNPYTETEWGKFTGTCASEEVPKNNFGKNFHSCDYSVPKEEIPVFESVSFPFQNVFDNNKSLPIMGSAMIDIDNDGVDEVFVSGGVTQEDAIFKYENGGFKDISAMVKLPKKPVNTTTYGAASFDMDNDGNIDLFLAGDYGVIWLKNKGGVFTLTNLNVPLNDKSVPLSITIGDVNRDGHADIFVSNYIKISEMEGQTIFKDFTYGSSSLMMMNNGDDTFFDATQDLGLTYIHNTFSAVLVDLDNDGFLDLVVAYDTGEVRTYKNNGGKSYKMIENPITGKYAYPMGIAVGDYNNDGNIDLFFSNTGSSVPTFLARGDLAKDDEYISDWILFRNDGNFNFTDVAVETKVSNFEFSWGAIFEDFNLDGLQDLVVAENYVDFPPHKLFKLPGRFLIQRKDGTFSAVEDQAKAINKNYAITPLSSDFNQDGYPDLIFVNLNGKIKALINKGGEANFLAVRLHENVENVGARIQVNKNDGTILSDSYILGEGLASDQTSTVTFGLGNITSVKSIVINYINGNTHTINNPEINKVHRL
ncbi:MAG: VCBS repeat-containing protein [Saprospiraceae bacterium]